MPYSSQERVGVIDLLQTNRQNVEILFQLAKSVTKNVIDISTENEALDTIFLHVPDSTTLLNKRVIKKEVLFKYLHKKKVPQTADMTKSQLVQKIIEYWYQVYDTHQTTNNYCDIANSNLDHKYNNTNNSHILDTSEFPIHLLARKFSEWFFYNYNENTLKLIDFWSDASLVLEISANDGIDQQICEDSNTVLESLLETRRRFGFYFNPNLTHAGVQGRMDVHGLVLVLTCGTLHTELNCVGVFECVFGLLRDPYAENNWKSKNIKLTLRSKGTPGMPSLEESDTLKEALELPVPQGELT